jgi:ketosteroid isomerase-like protein
MSKKVLLYLIILLTCSCKSRVTPEEEMQVILSVIDSNIGWAKTKDTTLLYSTMIQTEDLFFFQPDSEGVIEGFNSFRKMTEEFFLRPEFQAVRHELKNPKIYLSKSGTVAWFSAYLDDINKWKGKEIAWRNVRWTGVLEKSRGQWRIVQMHFSFPVKQ